MRSVPNCALDASRASARNAVSPPGGVSAIRSNLPGYGRQAEGVPELLELGRVQHVWRAGDAQVATHRGNSAGGSSRFVDAHGAAKCGWVKSAVRASLLQGRKCVHYSPISGRSRMGRLRLQPSAVGGPPQVPGRHPVRLPAGSYGRGQVGVPHAGGRTERGLPAGRPE